MNIHKPASKEEFRDARLGTHRESVKSDWNEVSLLY